MWVQEIWRKALFFGQEIVNEGNENKALQQAFTPEFRNRFDGIISFNHLSQNNMTHITSKFLNELSEQLKKKKVHLKITDKALNLLAEEGYDPHYGARPLVRTIQEKVKKPLSKEDFDQEKEND